MFVYSSVVVDSKASAGAFKDPHCRKSDKTVYIGKWYGNILLIVHTKGPYLAVLRGCRHAVAIVVHEDAFGACCTPGGE